MPKGITMAIAPRMRGSAAPIAASAAGWVAGGSARLFEHGDLRLVITALLAEKPRYGYEIIKALEERVGGGYSPSPGVIYPTLTRCWKSLATSRCRPPMARS